MARSPGFTTAAILVLGLGIGVNAAVFRALESLLLSAPPYPEPDGLVLVDLSERSAETGAQAHPWSYPKFEQFRGLEAGAFEALAGFAPWSVTLVTSSQSLRVPLEFVSAEYLTMLGATAWRGRLPGAADDDPAAPSAVAVMSARLWQAQFGNEYVAGQTVEIEGRPVEIVGVMDRGFAALTGAVDVWMPMTSSALLFGRAMVAQSQAHWFRVMGRLRSGVSVEAAAARAETAVRQAEREFTSPMPGRTMTATVRLLRDARVHPSARAAVLVLAGAALLVLLIACANLAGLLLARGLARRHEVAVQVALGARRSRVVFGLLVEHFVLAGAGGIAGLGVAQLGILALRGAWPERFAMSAGGGGGFAALRALDAGALSLDPATLTFAAGLTLLTGLLFGLAPALNLSSAQGSDALRAGARLANAARTARYRTGLIAVEVALALVLLAGAGLMMSTMTRLLRVDRGFDAQNLLTFSYSIPRSSVHSRDAWAFHAELLAQLRTDARVAGAATGCAAPMSGHCVLTSVAAAEGRPPIEESARPQIGMHRISDDYFETLGVAILSGRAFDARETASSLPVAILNRTAVRQLFGNEDPLGRTLSIPAKFGPAQVYTVVGVAGDVLHGGPAGGMMAEAYLPMRQAAPRDASVIVRTTVAPIELVPAIRARLRALEPGIAMADVRTAESIDAVAMADTRVMLWLLGIFAVSAVLLSAIGIWSVVAYTVSQRTREIGVRMALGAEAREVVRLVLRSGARAAALGVILGVPAALAASRLLQGLLFGTQPADPRVHAVAAVTLAAVALLAGWIPALRATRVDPMRSMRAH